MDPISTYADLSLSTQKIIDIKHFVGKVQANGYSMIALDYQLNDAKPESFKPAQKPTIQGINILNRATLILQNSSSLHPLGQQKNPYNCDIFAIKPLNQKMFHTICVQYDNYDIITFDIGNKLPFMLKRNPVYQAIRKGKFFQITYQSMFDQTKRVVAMTNIINIIKATNGKNLIISSHASSTLTHRTPYDVAALLISLGLDKNKALASMKQNCHEVIRNGKHRQYLQGIIKQIPVSVGIKLNKRIQKHRQNFKMMVKKIQQQKQQMKNEK